MPNGRELCFGLVIAIALFSLSFHQSCLRIFIETSFRRSKCDAIKLALCVYHIFVQLCVPLAEKHKSLNAAAPVQLLQFHQLFASRRPEDLWHQLLKYFRVG